jgi:hypothetical protein
MWLSLPAIERQLATGAYTGLGQAAIVIFLKKLKIEKTIQFLVFFKFFKFKNQYCGAYTATFFAGAS